MDIKMIPGLRGEVFEVGGKVAIAVPPKGIEGAIAFEVLGVHAPSDDYPVWADMLVNGLPVRINPEIVKLPFTRLADCIAMAHHNRDKIPTFPEAVEIAFPPLPHPNAETFCFSATKINDEDVILIDTKKRIDLETKKAKGRKTYSKGKEVNP